MNANESTVVRRKRRSLRECESGAELIEFALIFPTLLLVMLGIIDFGFLFQRYEVLTNAAREGARIAILPGYADGDIQARVTQYLTSSGLTGTANVTVGAPQQLTVGGACITVRPVTVAYDHSYLFVGPIIGLLGGSGFSNKTLTATSAMLTEMAAGGSP
jgi:Flp pilus assembly protein TadG